MAEEWPYESKSDPSKDIETLERDLKKVKNQLYQTLLNSNKIVNENQEMQQQLNQLQIENSKLKSQIAELKKKLSN